MVGAGWYFAGHVAELKRELHWVELAVAVAVAAAAGEAAWILVVRRRGRRAAGDR